MSLGTHSVVLVRYLLYVTHSVVQRKVDVNLRENTILLPLESVERQLVTVHMARIISN